MKKMFLSVARLLCIQYNIPFFFFITESWKFLLTLLGAILNHILS